MNDKELRSLHPLYKRLSGEVLWLFLEEHGFSGPECDALIERFLGEMKHNISLMRKLAQDGSRFLLLQQGADNCPACAALHNHLIAASRADWLEFMPPFGIGCAMQASVLSRQAALDFVTELERNVAQDKTRNKAHNRTDNTVGGIAESMAEGILESLSPAAGLAPPKELCCPVFFGAEVACTLL